MLDKDKQELPAGFEEIPLPEGFEEVPLSFGPIPQGFQEMALPDGFEEVPMEKKYDEPMSKLEALGTGYMSLVPGKAALGSRLSQALEIDPILARFRKMGITETPDVSPNMKELGITGEESPTELDTKLKALGFTGDLQPDLEELRKKEFERSKSASESEEEQAKQEHPALYRLGQAGNIISTAPILGRAGLVPGGAAIGAVGAQDTSSAPLLSQQGALETATGAAVGAGVGAGLGVLGAGAQKIAGLPFVGKAAQEAASYITDPLSDVSSSIISKSPILQKLAIAAKVKTPLAPGQSAPIMAEVAEDVGALSKKLDDASDPISELYGKRIDELSAQNKTVDIAPELNQIEKTVEKYKELPEGKSAEVFLKQNFIESGEQKIIKPFEETFPATLSGEEEALKRAQLEVDRLRSENITAEPYVNKFTSGGKEYVEGKVRIREVGESEKLALGSTKETIPNVEQFQRTLDEKLSKLKIKGKLNVEADKPVVIQEAGKPKLQTTIYDNKTGEVLGEVKTPHIKIDGEPKVSLTQPDSPLLEKSISVGGPKENIPGREEFITKQMVQEDIPFERSITDLTPKQLKSKIEQTYEQARALREKSPDLGNALYEFAEALRIKFYNADAELSKLSQLLKKSREATFDPLATKSEIPTEFNTQLRASVKDATWASKIADKLEKAASSDLEVSGAAQAKLNEVSDKYKLFYDANKKEIDDFVRKYNGRSIPTPEELSAAIKQVQNKREVLIKGMGATSLPGTLAKSVVGGLIGGSVGHAIPGVGYASGVAGAAYPLRQLGMGNVYRATQTVTQAPKAIAKKVTEKVVAAVKLVNKPIGEMLSDSSPEELMIIGKTLEQTGATKHLGMALQRAINEKNEFLKNATIFSIMQNPAAKQQLQPEAEDKK